MSERGMKRVVEEGLASEILEGLSGIPLGDAVVSAIDTFAFRYIETPDDAVELFSFIQDQDQREHIAQSYRGARWQAKIGLMFARPVEHPAHHAQVRAQLIEYGSLAEASLRIMLIQNGKDAPPEDFDGIIKKARAAGVLSGEGALAAQKLRSARNRVHLFIDSGAKSLVADRDARRAYTCLVKILQECRTHAKLPEWKFGNEWEPDGDH